jgi:hypothetical protein
MRGWLRFTELLLVNLLEDALDEIPLRMRETSVPFCRCLEVYRCVYEGDEKSQSGWQGDEGGINRLKRILIA